MWYFARYFYTVNSTLNAHIKAKGLYHCKQELGTDTRFLVTRHCVDEYLKINTIYYIVRNKQMHHLEDWKLLTIFFLEKLLPILQLVEVDMASSIMSCII